MIGSSYFQDVLDDVRSAFPQNLFNDFSLIKLGDFDEKELNFNESAPETREVCEKLYDNFGKQIGFRKKYYSSSTRNKLNNEMVSSSFPPSDILISKDGDYCINVAVAGYAKEDVKVDIDAEDDNYLVVTLGKKPIEEKEDKEKEKKEKQKTENKDVVEEKQIYIQRGIKTKYTQIRFFVDPKKFDIEDIKGEIVNGILYLTIGKNKNVKKVALSF